MTKKEYCLNHPAIAGYQISNCFWWGFHGIEYGIDDAAYLSLHSDTGLVSYHRRRIYTTNGDNARDYVKVGNSRLYLNDFLRV